MDALMLLKNNPMDLLILDVMLPCMDGIAVCGLAREISNMPVIMLTAKGGEEDKRKGCRCGADDYMTMPFSPKVLQAKANALLRRSSAASAGTISAGRILLQSNARRLPISRPCGRCWETRNGISSR